MAKEEQIDYIELNMRALLEESKMPEDFEHGDPESLLKTIVHDAAMNPAIFDKPVYGPPPYPLGFTLSKTSGHWGALFAPIQGYEYAKKPVASQVVKQMVPQAPSAAPANQFRTVKIVGAQKQDPCHHLFAQYSAMMRIQEGYARAQAPINGRQLGPASMNGGQLHHQVSSSVFHH